MNLDAFATDLFFFLAHLLIYPALLVCGGVIVGSFIHMFIFAYSGLRSKGGAGQSTPEL